MWLPLLLLPRSNDLRLDRSCSLDGLTPFAGYADWMQDHQFGEWFDELVPLAAPFAQDGWVYTDGGEEDDGEMDLNAVLLDSVEKVSVYAGTYKDKQNKKDKPAVVESSVDQITTEEWVRHLTTA